MLKQKKAQSEVITSVLIILVVIVVVALVAGFIMNKVRSGISSSEEKSACIGMFFEVKEAVNGSTSVKVARGNDKADLSEIRILVDDQRVGSYMINSTSPLDAQTSAVVTVSNQLATGQTVEVIPVLKGGNVCDKIGSKKVTAE